jgi:phospholipid/cholesterol/gamma-HCH transport system substrate-binding protein
MAQRKQLTWGELRVGLFVLAALFVLIVAIFYVTGSGSLGPKYQITTYLPEVETLQPGAPVRLDGVEIGSVDSIQLNPQPSDEAHNIKLVLRINKRYAEYIRTGSTASLVTEGLLGNRYVTISRSLVGTPVPSGGEVKGTEEAAMKRIIQRGVELEENLGALSQQIGEVVSDVRKGRGTLGKLLTDPTLYNNMNATVVKAESIVTATQQGQGTLGKLVASDELYQKVNASVDHAQNILAAVREQKGTLGKFVYDPAVYQETKQFAERGNAVLGDVREGKGTLGKLAKDETLYNNLRDASANVSEATARLNSNTGTMGKFFSDPHFYDNVTGLSGDLRILVGEFQQNPKKFLHIKLGVF